MLAGLGVALARARDLGWGYARTALSFCMDSGRNRSFRARVRSDEPSGPSSRTPSAQPSFLGGRFSCFPQHIGAKAAAAAIQAALGGHPDAMRLRTPDGAGKSPHGRLLPRRASPRLALARARAQTKEAESAPIARSSSPAWARRIGAAKCSACGMRCETTAAIGRIARAGPWPRRRAASAGTLATVGVIGGTRRWLTGATAASASASWFGS
jgi:hypothetical protein